MVCLCPATLNQSVILTGQDCPISSRRSRASGFVHVPETAKKRPVRDGPQTSEFAQGSEM